MYLLSHSADYLDENGQVWTDSVIFHYLSFSPFEKRGETYSKNVQLEKVPSGSFNGRRGFLSYIIDDMFHFFITIKSILALWTNKIFCIYFKFVVLLKIVIDYP
jgi:hypothetical protein